MEKIRKPLVSIIIVNWNGLKELKTCLPKLFRQNYKNFELILVDNNSVDGSKEYIIKNYPKTVFIENDDNYGFAQGCNIGYKKAKGKYILLLNNDTHPTKDFLFLLVRFLEENKAYSIVQPKIIAYETGKLQSGCAFLTDTGFLYHFGYGKNPKLAIYNKERDIFSANGSCMLIKKTLINTIGLFDKSYFAYVEETDFCWRALLTGTKIKYLPKALIYHTGSQTSRRLPSTFILYHSTKNRFQTIIKNATTPIMFRMLLYQIVFAHVFILYGLSQGTTKQLVAVYQAFWTILKNVKKLQEKRKQINLLRKVTEQEAFKDTRINPRLSYYYYLVAGAEKYKDTI